jgi:hypothetical protein
MKFPRHMPWLSIVIAFHFSSASSSYLRKIFPATIASPSGTSSSFCMTVILSRLNSRFLEFLSDSSSTYVWNFSSISLDFLPGQLLLCFQCHLISVFHHSHRYHVDFIMYFISQAINIPGIFFFIVLLMSSSDVHPVKLFSVLLH